MVFLLTDCVTLGLTFAAAAAMTTDDEVAAEAGCVATSWPASRERPRDTAMLPVPSMRRRLELRSCTVESSLRHACEVSCRVRAGESARPPWRLHPKALGRPRTATAEGPDHGSPVPAPFCLFRSCS